MVSLDAFKPTQNYRRNTKRYLIFVTVLLLWTSYSYRTLGQVNDFNLNWFRRDTIGISRLLHDVELILDKKSSSSVSSKKDAILSQISLWKFPPAQCYSLLRMGIYMDHRGLGSASIDFFEQGLLIANEVKDYRCSELFTDRLFNLYSRINEPGKALELLNSQGKIYVDNSRVAESFYCLYLMGLLYFQNAEYEQCIMQCFKIDSAARVLPAGAKKSIESQWISNWNTAGLSYQKLKRFSDALVCYDSAKAIAKRFNNEFMMALADGNASVSYIELRNFNKAIPLLLVDIRMSKKNRDLLSATASAIMLGRVFLELGKLGEVRTYLDSAHLWLASGSNHNVQLGYHKLKADYHYATEKFREAYDELKLANAYQDSVNRKTNSAALSKALSKANFVDRAKTIQLLQAKTQLQSKDLETSIIFNVSLIVLSSIILITLYIVFNMYKGKKRNSELLQEKNDEIQAMIEEINVQNEYLNEKNEEIKLVNQSLEEKINERTSDLRRKNEELDMFLYRSSHDIRGPIATIMGLQHIFNLSSHDEESTDLFNKVFQIVEKMDATLGKIRMIYDMSHVDEEIEEIDLNVFVREAVKPFENKMVKTGITLRYNLSGEKLVRVQKFFLHLIVKNVVENCIVFARTSAPEISISTSTDQDGFKVLKIKDNGVGINDKYLPFVFNPFFRASENSAGAGLGLYLVKSAAERIGVKIQLISEVDSGTSVIITFPNAVLSEQLQESKNWEPSTLVSYQ